MAKTLFPNMFAQKPGFFMQNFLHVMFKRIDIDKGLLEQLRMIAKKGTLIYVTKYHSHFDFIMYHYCLRKARLPYPRLGFDINMSLYLPFNDLFSIIRSYIAYIIKKREFPSPYDTGFYKEAILNRITGIIPLINPKGFSRYFIDNKKEPLSYVVEVQKEIDFPIFLVPLTILYRRKPEKAGSGISKILFSHRDKEGIFAKLAIFFKQHRKAFIDIGNPVNLQQHIRQKNGEANQVSSYIRQELIDAIDRQKRAVIGPVVKSRQQIKEMVLRHKNIDRTIRNMARGDREKIRELRKKAEKYFEEIASNYSVTYITIFHYLLKWLWKKSFQGIDVSEREFSEIRGWAKKGYPIVYVPSHKSHVDYLVLNYLLFDNHIYPPRIAAGNNLAFWPMGYIFRRSGAFFVRRSFRGARLYMRVFDQYVKVLLQEGYPIEFFIEGGRSRSGKLELPKTGLLSMLISAWKGGYCEDIIFIPVSINYDRVVEEDSYVKEIKGIEKEPESLKHVIRARNILKKRYGRIYVRFSSSISLKEYSRKKNASQENLALDLVKSINSITIVTPLSFISVAIMTKHRKGFYLYELIPTCKMILDFLQHCDAPIVSAIKDEMEDVIRRSISFLVEEKILIRIEEQGHKEDFYCLNEKKSFELGYYKNNIIHYFIPYGFVAVSFLSCPDETINIESLKRDYLLLSDMFKHEFIYDVDPDRDIEKAIRYFHNKRFIVLEKDRFKLTGLGAKNLVLWSELIRTYIESYWIAVKVFSRVKGKKTKQKELLKKMKTEGDNLYELKVIKHLDSISYITFKNAISYIKENISREGVHQFSQLLYSLLQGLPS